MFIKLFLAFALFQSAPTQISSYAAPMEITQDAPVYVVVYKMNGGYHVHWSEHELCCSCLQASIDYFQLKIEIIDCGPINGISVPPSAGEVTPEQFAEDFKLGHE